MAKIVIESFTYTLIDEEGFPEQQPQLSVRAFVGDPKSAHSKVGAVALGAMTFTKAELDAMGPRDVAVDDQIGQMKTTDLLQVLCWRLAYGIDRELS